MDKSVSKKFKLFTFVLLILTLPVKAGPVTLGAQELSSLRKLLSMNGEAAIHFERLREAADAALEKEADPAIFIIGEGRLQSDPNRLRSRSSLKDMQKIEALAWSWAVTGNINYFEAARRYILAWAQNNQSDGNPINETKFEPLVKAYDLVRDDFSRSEREMVDKWLWHKADKLVRSSKKWRGNWRSHCLKMVGLIGLTIGDRDLWGFAYVGFKQQLLEDFANDGSSFDFKNRDALHYHIYAIEPLAKLACAARQEKPLMFSYNSPSGASLRQAFDFLESYALGLKKHTEFANSQVRFDRIRANAGESEYKVHEWKPSASILAFVEAGCLDHHYSDVAKRVANDSGGKIKNWRAVLNVVINDERR